MRRIALAGVLALVVLGLQQSSARADHGCPSYGCGHGGHCGPGHGLAKCFKCCPHPIDFPLPCICIPIPKPKIWCACPPESWGAESAWYNHWPTGNVAPAGSPFYMTQPGAAAPVSISSVPYYWNGR
jgi:hypothetical protein